MQISTFGDAHEFISFVKNQPVPDVSHEMTIENSWQALMKERDETMKASQIATADVSMLTAAPLIETQLEDSSMNVDASSVIFDDIDFDDLPFPSQITWTWQDEPVQENEILEANSAGKEAEDEQAFDEFEFELDWALTQRMAASQNEVDEDEGEDEDGASSRQPMNAATEQPIVVTEQTIDVTEQTIVVTEEVPLQFIGFTSGLERVIPPPSEKALKRAQQIIGDPLETKPETEEILVGFTTGKGRFLPPPSKEAMERAKKITQDTPPTESIGFCTGKGKAMPPPSEAALKRAQSLINDLEEVKEAPISIGFSTGKGRALPPPSNEALKRAKRLIEPDEPIESDESINSFANEPFSVGFSTGKGRTLPPPSKEALLKAHQLTSSAAALIDEPSPDTAIGFSSGKGRILPPPSKEALERATKLIHSEDKENIPAPIVSIKAPPPPQVAINRSSLSAAFRRPRLQAKPNPPNITKPTPPISSKAKPISLFNLSAPQPRQKLAQYFPLPTRHPPSTYSRFNM